MTTVKIPNMVTKCYHFGPCVVSNQTRLLVILYCSIYFTLWIGMIMEMFREHGVLGFVPTL